MDYTSVKILPGGGYWVSVPELGHHGSAIDLDKDGRPDAFVTGDPAQVSSQEWEQIQQGSSAVSQKIQKEVCGRSQEEMLVDGGQHLKAARRFAAKAPNYAFYDNCPFKQVREMRGNEFYTRKTGTAGFDRGVAAATKVHDLMKEFIRDPKKWTSSDRRNFHNEAGETLRMSPVHNGEEIIGLEVFYSKVSEGYTVSEVQLRIEDPQLVLTLYDGWKLAVPNAQKK